MSTIHKVGVVGAGTMGSGIAQVFAQAGTPVVLMDTDTAGLQRAADGIAKSLEKFVSKGKLTAEAAAAARERVVRTEDMKALADCDLVVEAVVERLEVKRQVFAQLDKLVQGSAVLASNTSSISITQIAAATKRPAQVAGMHFMNPVPLMTLVELIRGQLTSEETMRLLVYETARLGKTGVEVSDYPGFVSNRVLLPMINEAIYCVMEGVATPESVDTVMKLGMNHPMGPLALADMIGLDVCLHILEVLQRDLGDSKYRPCPLLRRMVAAGLLGRKSGRGFYTY